jgi:N utilization substance protein B
MQALFFIEARGHAPAEGIPLFCKTCALSKKSLPFFLELVNGVAHCRDDIDRIIEGYSSNWRVTRMSGVDRNVMRIAVYEMLSREDIPPKVSINEAIDIGKRFGTEESGSFINGILDSIRKAVDGGDLSPQLECPPDYDSPVTIATEEDAAAETARSPSFLPVRGKQGVVKRRGTAVPPKPAGTGEPQT